MSFSKIDDIKNLTYKDLEEQIIEVKREIFDLKIKKATRQDIKPHLFKHQKHKLAQLLTIQSSKTR